MEPEAVAAGRPLIAADLHRSDWIFVYQPNGFICRRFSLRVNLMHWRLANGLALCSARFL
jgi:hypothetical protein